MQLGLRCRPTAIMYTKLQFEGNELFRESQNIWIMLQVNLSTETRKIQRNEKVTDIRKNHYRYFYKYMWNGWLKLLKLYTEQIVLWLTQNIKDISNFGSTSVFSWLKNHTVVFFISATANDWYLIRKLLLCMLVCWTCYYTSLPQCIVCIGTILSTAYVSEKTTESESADISRKVIKVNCNPDNTYVSFWF